MSKLIQLEKVLVSAPNFPWQHARFLPADRPWHLDSKCAVIDNRYDDLENPPFAVENSLRYTLEMGTVQEIVSNAREQSRNCDANTLLKALVFYFDNDAFITI